MPPIFKYGEPALAHLRRADKKMAAAIDSIGLIERTVIPDMFEALANAMVGQQISTRAHQTVWARLVAQLGAVTPAAIAQASEQTLRACGISGRKASYLKSAADEALSGRLDLTALCALPDDEVVACLTALRGVGVWTAEMLLIFSLERPDVMSFGDFGVRRGLCLLHHHRALPRERFERYRRRYSPYGSAASLYLWEIAARGGTEGEADVLQD